ncbi:hypothetical protein C9352_22240 [Escherichia coli]|nr:hypothetical protein [Escherichia coli]PDU36016.1 hypothetical protein A6V12_25750 [Escherichia coli]PDU75746.1 hypothetical protein A6V05_26865 [Escherichia coli]TIY87882.1 hypothetical protein C9352_22240 [Escherichia coli]
MIWQPEFTDKTLSRKPGAVHKEKKFPITQELYERLESVIHDYDGEISLCEAIGTLELLKQSLIEGAKESSA